LGTNLIELQQELQTETYYPRPYHKFVVYEHKPRLIHAPAFRDVIVQHAIYHVIYPLFDKTFIDTNFACRKGKGTHRCADYVQQSMRFYHGNFYTLHLDIRKFFYSIDQTILLNLINKKIKDERLLRVMNLYIKTDDDKGIPIGNLLSQLYALIYLNPIDHFIKRELKIKHYARYVDDLVLIGLKKEEAIRVRNTIANFLFEHLNLMLSKATIATIRRGLNFVGYRTWRKTRFVRRHSLHYFGKCLLLRNTKSLTSLMSHARHTGTFYHYCNRIKTE